MCNEVQACASLQRIMGRMNDPPLLRIGRKENALAKDAGPYESDFSNGGLSSCVALVIARKKAIKLFLCDDSQIKSNEGIFSTRYCVSTTLQLRGGKCKMTFEQKNGL